MRIDLKARWQNRRESKKSLSIRRQFILQDSRIFFKYLIAYKTLRTAPLTRNH